MVDGALDILTARSRRIHLTSSIHATRCAFIHCLPLQVVHLLPRRQPGRGPLSSKTQPAGGMTSSGGISRGGSSAFSPARSSHLGSFGSSASSGHSTGPGFQVAGRGSSNGHEPAFTSAAGVHMTSTPSGGTSTAGLGCLPGSGPTRAFTAMHIKQGTVGAFLFDLLISVPVNGRA